MTFISMLESGLYASKEFIFGLIFLGGSLIFYGKNVITGLIISFGISAFLFVVYYLLSWDFSVMLKILMILLAVMALMLFFIRKQGQSDYPGVY